MSLFPVKLFHLVTELQSSQVFAKLAHAAAHLPPVQVPADGLTRLVLCSPEVQQVVAAEVGTRQIRVRLALPTEFDLVSLSNQAQLEVYSAEGTPLQPPRLLTALTGPLANALQVELFHALLAAQGSRIPML